MNAIETLQEEHRLIERVLTAFERYVSAMDSADGNTGDLATFLSFFRDFADALHHDKEESILFRAMIEAGFSRTAGPVAVMLHEHDSGRRLIGEIAAISGTDGPWTPDQHELLRTSARAYIELLRAHIHKEDNILYPMARRSVPPDAQHGVSTECARVDVERAAQALALTELAHTLIRTYAPAP